MMSKIVAQGAEALLRKQGKNLIKDRIKKSYRLPIIDEKLRKRRTKAEAKLLDKVGNIINVPLVEKVTKYEIVMQFIDGKLLSENLDSFPLTKALEIYKEVGKEIALLHSHDIIHADLTTSNMILHADKVYFIDFGLSYFSSRIEDKAVDLHLLKQALEAKHFKHAKKYFQSVLQAYKKYEKSKEVLVRLEKVEKRGRYKRKGKRKKDKGKGEK